MEKESLLNFLKKNIPNISVDREALLKIADQFEERSFEKNDHLLKSGKISDYFFLSEGFLRVYTYDTDGNEVTTYFYPQGRIVFDASSFFLHNPSTENIQALTKCIGYFTTFEKLNTLFHTVPEFREFGRQMIVTEFVAYKQRTLAMINLSAEERYLQLMKANRDIFQYAQLKHIASYLGVSERTLNRIRLNSTKK
ncbi:Crp/Fnr family transcriptional regulator [Pedobacter psychrophilus]|uniref:Crp/Fnr family transcriptional regulator n=1 Tax=Pedobacter psychrophilus TaxID=1826909 RepID=A0A179DKI0_9SPHI|nr:Crp/Fnr family transcriptional regulator [Pedobacter psychrophilus]OAQ41617.1 Crp/Fnr family transcriptional regulator [Pedobacter psychrophilus]